MPATIEKNDIEIVPAIIDENAPETGSICHAINVPSEPPDDPTSEQRMRIMEVSGSLDFWDDPREDVYTLEDGEPV